MTPPNVAPTALQSSSSMPPPSPSSANLIEAADPSRANRIPKPKQLSREQILFRKQVANGKARLAAACWLEPFFEHYRQTARGATSDRDFFLACYLMTSVVAGFPEHNVLAALLDQDSIPIEAIMGGLELQSWYTDLAKSLKNTLAQENHIQLLPAAMDSIRQCLRKSKVPWADLMVAFSHLAVKLRGLREGQPRT